MSEYNIPSSIFYSKPILSASAGRLSSNNRVPVAELDVGIKKVSPEEQRLIYQLCYVWIQLITCITIRVVISESVRNLLLEND